MDRLHWGSWMEPLGTSPKRNDGGDGKPWGVALNLELLLLQPSRKSGQWQTCQPDSGSWGFRPQTPKTAPHCKFLSTRLQVTWLESSTFWKKRYFSSGSKFFVMKEHMGAVLFQNHRRSQGGGLRRPGFLNRNATNNKDLTKRPCFFIFSFF